MFSRNTGSQKCARPLVLISYALNYQLGGYAARGYHLVNLAIHLFCAWTAYALFRRLGQASGMALLAALLFVVHPLASEPVNYISSRSESLASLFFLLSLLLYLRHQGERVAPGSVIAFAAALLAKSTAITLPLLLWAYEWSRGRGGVQGLWRRHWPYWALAVAYVWGTRGLIREALVEAPVRSLSAHWSTQIKALIYYAKLVVLPHPLSVEHQFFESSSPFAARVLCSLLGPGVWGLSDGEGLEIHGTRPSSG